MLYNPGFSGLIDTYGREADCSASLSERAVCQGLVWRIGTGYQELVAKNDKLFLSFKTPTAAQCDDIHYGFSTINKSGDEVIFTLNEGGVLTNGTTTTALNLNRVIGDTGCLITAIKYGKSTDTSPVSLAGGTDLPYNLLPGTAGGNSRPGGTSSGAPFIKLKYDTVYTVVFIAKGAVSINAIVDIVVA